MYSQYMASAPPLSLENETPNLNGYLKRTDSNKRQNGTFIHQDSTETNTSEDIKPSLLKGNEKEIFTVANQLAKIETNDMRDKSSVNEVSNVSSPKNFQSQFSSDEGADKLSLTENNLATKSNIPNVLRPRRNILEPIKKDALPSWSLAKGPCVVAMQKKTKSVNEEGAYSY